MGTHSKTYYGRTHWWQVDLLGVFNISKIVVDLVEQNLLQNFEIYTQEKELVSDGWKLCANILTVISRVTVMTCKRNARFLRINSIVKKRYDKDVTLQLAEVKVYGEGRYCFYCHV